MEKPNPHYALLKRRLDLIWVAFSVTIAWSVFTFATFYPLSSSLFSSLVGVIVVVLSLLTILTLSTFFIVKGWNDSLTTQEASWF